MLKSRRLNSELRLELFQSLNVGSLLWIFGLWCSNYAATANFIKADQNSLGRCIVRPVLLECAVCIDHEVAALCYLLAA